MKKIVITCGLIAGLIVSALMLAAMTKVYDPKSYTGSMILGFASMLLAFSFIFVAIKNYRDKEAGGVVNFGKAFKIGAMIALIASTMYVGVWMIYYYNFAPNFWEQECTAAIARMKAEGATQAAMNAKIAEMKYYTEFYKNPLANAAMTYCEILPLGLLVSVVAALILKRKTAEGEAVSLG